MLKASTIWRMRSICGRRSSGIFSRVPLYSGIDFIAKGFAHIESHRKIFGLFLFENADQFARKAVNARSGFAFGSLPALAACPPAVRAKYMR